MKRESWVILIMYSWSSHELKNVNEVMDDCSDLNMGQWHGAVASFPKIRSDLFLD